MDIPDKVVAGVTDVLEERAIGAGTVTRDGLKSHLNEVLRESGLTETVETLAGLVSSSQGARLPRAGEGEEVHCGLADSACMTRFRPLSGFPASGRWRGAGACICSLPLGWPAEQSEAGLHFSPRRPPDSLDFLPLWK